MKVRVTAPYVTVKVAVDGGVAVRGFYTDSVIEASPEAVGHLLRKRMVEEIKPEPDAPKEPKEPTVKEILEAVGDDAEKAAEALAAEQAKGDAARKSLVEGLETVIAMVGESTK
jgi:hypothetical protein